MRGAYLEVVSDALGSLGVVVAGAVVWLTGFNRADVIVSVAIALFMVAASIPGRSEIRNATPIRRAHPHFVENLRSLGARVEWTAEE